MRLLIWVPLLWFLLCPEAAPASSYVQKQCGPLVDPVRKSHQATLGIDYPYWYSVSQAYAESSCRWIVSRDGHGSVGYFQLTPKFLDPVLRAPFPNYTVPNHPHHFYAVAYYMKILHNRQNPTDRLWITFQLYNGGGWVLKECRKAGAWDWEYCQVFCLRGQVCVERGPDGSCQKYRSACDINYDYSRKIFIYGQAFRPENETDQWRFW
jgi:hypothetical protein